MLPNPTNFRKQSKTEHHEFSNKQFEINEQKANGFSSKKNSLKQK